jgi:hypothetical protein
MKSNIGSKTLFIAADHGMAIVYFLQSQLVPTLLEAGIEIILLTGDSLKERIEDRFGQPGLTVEGLRLDQAEAYAKNHYPEVQWWLNYLRRVGSSNRINTEAMDSYIEQVAIEQPNRRRIFLPFASLLIGGLRRSDSLRKSLVKVQARYNPRLYSDLFKKHRPAAILASTPGWRLDRYLLREAASQGIPTGAVVVGWDNPSSYSISGAPMKWINCWSEIQKEELVQGSDWRPESVYVTGIPSYDGYINRKWVIPKKDYFELHNLDPGRKLLSYACSFISFAPNIRNVESLAKLVTENQLNQPCQLLIRLHPNHFLDVHLFERERRQIHYLANEYAHVHVVEPVPLGGELGHYSGEDMPEKASMLSHSDVFLTVYSTMVVEAAVHDTPVVSVCIDVPGGWNTERKYSLPLSKIGDWPTHQRFRTANAGRVAFEKNTLKEAINEYLNHPEMDQLARRGFVEQEITFTDGKSGRRAAEAILNQIER